jgi:hypothetical protein
MLWLVLPLLVFAAPLMAQNNYAPDDERVIVRLVNEERQSRGLPTLAVDERLQQAARLHSERMAETGEVEHWLRGEQELSQRLKAVRSDATGENVALSSGAERAHTALMHSPGHRANILDKDYNSIGVGVVRTSKGIYVTEDFARRVQEASVDEVESQIAQHFNRLRRAAGMPALSRRPAPELRSRACAMAAQDRVDPHAGIISRSVSNSVVFTQVDPTKIPESLQRLKNQEASAFSVGGCYRSSASYENPVFWMIVVTYF